MEGCPQICDFFFQWLLYDLSFSLFLKISSLCSAKHSTVLQLFSEYLGLIEIKFILGKNGGVARGRTVIRWAFQRWIDRKTKSHEEVF